MKTKRLPIAFAILIVFIGANCGKKTAISDELIGVWKTMSPKYKGCFFELQKSTITIGPKEGEPNTFAITNIKRKKENRGEWALYTVYYVDLGGKEYEFPIYYLPEKNGVIRFANQEKVVWTRENHQLRMSP
ncbi:MAG: hypothetical protein JSV96_14175 [Candidatus Aminicenantes bacterium]|nr:MAG: hypothetical protein JSV96_14175 [Candidatus Aminicenantes bacterium]